MYTKASLFIVIFLLLTLISSEAKAACTESDNVATCSGVFDSTEFPIRYTAEVDGVSQVILDSTVDATIGDGQGFELVNGDSSMIFDLSITQQDGAVINRIGDPGNDLFLVNRGLGHNKISISGKTGFTRLWNNLPDNTGDNTIVVSESGVIDNVSGTAVWIRNQGLGSSTANIDGVLSSGELGVDIGFRALHISQNNTLSTESVNVAVGEAADIFSNHQALYVGHAGAGLTSFDIDGKVFSAARDRGTITIPGAIVMENESGGSEVNISSTGSVIALSDLAILDRDDYRNTGVDAFSNITNNGLIIGYANLGGGGDNLTNNSPNSFNFRDFRDDDFDGQRDTENVAVNNFGSGVDSFTNTATGTLRLLTVQDMNGFTAATDDDATPGLFNSSGVAEYFPEGSAALPNMMSGIEQGHIVGLETFTQAGVITMADAETGGIEPVAGDTLVITGSDTAGSDGDGDFISEGGSLHLDVQLDDGTTDTTDVLVVDNVTTGSEPTTITVTNANGLGALTGNGAKDGILVVEVLGASSADAFVLDGDTIQVGTYGYFLIQADDQNWYLQSVPLPLLTANDVGPTYTTRPLMSGTTDAADGQVVTVVNDSGSEVCTVTVSADEWSCTPNSSIAAGTFTYSASVTDTFGNTVTADFQVIVKEPMAPLVTIIEDTNDDGIIDYTELSGDIDVTVTLPANAEAGDTLVIDQDGNSESRVLTAGDIGEGQVALTYPVPANGESISVTALIQLDDGTQTSSSSDSAIMNAVAPAITANDVGPTYTTRPLMSGTTSVSDGQVVTVTNDGGVEVCTVAVSSKQWSCTPGMEISAGTFTYTASVTDIFGSKVSEDFQVIILETVLPPMITANDVGPTYTTRPLMSGTTDAADGQVVTVVNDSGSEVCTVTVSSKQWGCTPGMEISAGTFTYTASVTDIFGNRVSEDFQVIILETVLPPMITANDVGPTYTTRPLMSGTTDAADGQVVTVVNDSGSEVCTVTVSADEWSCTPNSSIAAGTFTYSASVTDTFGNTVTADFQVIVKEPMAPLVTIIEDTNDDGIIDYTELSGDIDVTVTLPANAEAGDTLVIDQDGNSESRVLTAGDIGEGQVALTYPVPANGESISVTALIQLDDGTQTSSSSDSAIIDSIAPVITGEDVADTYNTQPSLTGSTNLPDDTKVTVTDNNGNTICTAVVSGGKWRCTPIAELPLGNNSLTASAQDSLGITVNDTFIVSIIDGGALETSVDGYGGGSGSMWLLALLGLFGLLKTRPRLGVVAGVMALMMLPMTLNASEPDHQPNTEYEYDRWFLSVGYGASWVDPEGESFGWSTDDDESDGYKVFLGHQLSERWGLELSYADIGEAGLGNVDPKVNASANPEIDYKVSALMLSYAFFKPNESWDVYAKLGVSSISNSVNTSLVRYERQHLFQAAMGLGALYRFNQNWFMRAEIDSYDTDANFASLQVGRYFGGTSRTLVYTPIDVEQLKKDKQTAEEHQQPKEEKVFEPLYEKVYFGIDEFSLTAKAQKTLDNVIIFISNLDEPFVVDIEGHTDSTYTENYNDGLSARRAKAVKDYLVASDISESRVQSRYFGESNPVSSNKTQAGRALNRRVEIWVE